jgi:hypothetical protein
MYRTHSATKRTTETMASCHMKSGIMTLQISVLGFPVAQSELDQHYNTHRSKIVRAANVANNIPRRDRLLHVEAMVWFAMQLIDLN